MDDAYAKKMTKDLEFCATTKSLSSGRLGFCEHPECRDTISFSLPFVPGIDGTLGENLAEEFRVSAMEKGGNVIAAHIVGPLVNVLTVAISQSTAMRALQAQATALPDSNGVTARVNFADATVAETASK